MLYAGYYGRGADESGRALWIDELKQSGGNLSGVIQAFGSSEEFVETSAGLSIQEQVAQIYLNLFDRAPDPDGKSYWIEELNSGALELSQAPFALASAAGADDKVIMRVKIASLNEQGTASEVESEPVITEVVGSVTQNMVFGENDIVVFGDDVFIPEDTDILIGEGGVVYGGDNAMEFEGNVTVEGKMIFDDPSADISQSLSAAGVSDPGIAEVA